MIEKLKNYYKKITDKVSKSTFMVSLALYAFWQILFSVVCLIMIDNQFIDVLAIVTLVIGVIMGLAVIGVYSLVYVPRFAKYIVETVRGDMFAPKKEEKRLIAIKKNTSGNKKIRVAFYSDGGQFWSTFNEVYNMMCNDDRFETVVIAAPEMLKEEIYHYDALEFLDKNNIPYIKAYDNGKWFNPKKLKLDYVFFNRHYLLRQSKHSSFMKMRKYSKICYIPYAICPQVGAVENTLCRFNELRAFDYLFSENEMMTKIYTRYKKEYDNVITKIETVGSPKFAYAVTNANKEACHDKKYVQSVLYTPRWCFNEGTNSFHDLKDYFFKLVKENKDIEYIFRPHPLMKQAVEEVLGIDFWNEFIAEFDKYENAEIDFDIDYMKSFSRASVLVSDLSTMMFEFSTTEKPVVYMYKINRLNEFGKEASKGYYYCHNEKELDSVLKDLREGKDKMAAIRKEISQKLYHNNGISPAKNICEVIVNDYNK